LGSPHVKNNCVKEFCTEFLEKFMRELRNNLVN
jgi:hypothetical protein